MSGGSKPLTAGGLISPCGVLYSSPPDAEDMRLVQRTAPLLEELSNSEVNGAVLQQTEISDANAPGVG